MAVVGLEDVARRLAEYTLVTGRARTTAHNIRTGANISRHIIAMRLEEAADVIECLTRELERCARREEQSD